MTARAFILVGCLAASLTFAQGFINLDFESANLPIIPVGQSGGNVLVTDALPGWQVFYGTNSAPLSTIQYNNYNLGTINASILGPNFSSGPFIDAHIIEGSFTPFLQSGFAGSSAPPEGRAVSIAQTGLVPAGAQSLQFKLSGAPLPYFGAFLNGQSLSLSPLLTTSSYTLYGAPVGSFAGQLAELRFTVFSPDNHMFSDIGVDSFAFSSVPEPATWALLGLGGALLACAARRRRK